jgi:EpsI family protein
MSASYLGSRPAIVVSALLIGQIAAYHLIPTGEYLPDSRPLREFGETLDGWRSIRETEIESEVQALLKADDSMNREYIGPAGERVDLFVAFYRTQRAGVSPHSPRVCLPGSGWVFENTGRIHLDLPGRPQSPINRYTVRRRDDRLVALYWYQTAHRVIASEYAAKVYLLVDSLRYRRSDTWLVRVVTPVTGNNEDVAEQAAIRFVGALYAPLTGFLPQ